MFIDVYLKVTEISIIFLNSCNPRIASSLWETKPKVFQNFNVMTQVNLGSKQLLLMNSDNEWFQRKIGSQQLTSWVKGSFNNYVNQILPKFDSLLSRVDKNGHFLIWNRNLFFSENINLFLISHVFPLLEVIQVFITWK